MVEDDEVVEVVIELSIQIRAIKVKENTIASTAEKIRIEVGIVIQTVG